MLLNKIVVAEDDDAIAHLVAAALGDAGFLCLRARDGEEALALVRRESPDLLILDVMMPKADGFEVARQLKADVLSSRIPILMLTALGGTDNTVKGLDAGADDYLAKPFDMRVLAARAKALIRAATRERDRNPTTNLPGAQAVEDHVDVLLRKKTACALLYLDVEHFTEFADARGFRQAETVVADLGALIIATARAVAGGSAFVGHVGGDDFLVVVDEPIGEPLARELILAFESRVVGWMTGDDGAASARMTLSIAVVRALATGAASSEELARFLATTKRASKKRPGSNYVVWTPDAA